VTAGRSLLLQTAENQNGFLDVEAVLGFGEDLVGVLLFLLNTDAAGFITGICLPVDGGFSAYSGV
jgi:NAD(P)-dependent dehydrogenase (short-subunit alcohol dehydrogenase family)